MRLKIRKKSEEIHLFSLFPPEVTNIRSSNVKFPRVRHAAISRTTIFPWSFHFCQQDSYARSHNYFQQLSILSTRRRKVHAYTIYFTIEQQRAPTMYRSLFRKRIYRWVRWKKKKRKHERATDVASQQHPGPYPVVFFHPGASNIIFYLVEIERRRPNTTSSSWERTDRMYMRGVYIEAHPVVAVRTMPYPHRKSTVRFCGTKGRRSRRPVRAAILSDSVDGQERAGSRALKRKRGGRVACEGRREIPTVLRSQSVG